VAPPSRAALSPTGAFPAADPTMIAVNETLTGAVMMGTVMGPWAPLRQKPLNSWHAAAFSCSAAFCGETGRNDKEAEASDGLAGPARGAAAELEATRVATRERHRRLGLA
jgi:hypothetical protein